MAKAKSVSDSLKARNIDLVILLAAGKASFFPEYFPDSLALQPKMISNYDYLSYCIDSAGLNYIDFNSWFLKMKDTSQYALFPKGGIHWSKYGEYLVADSIIRYINSIRNVKLPYFELIDIELSSTPRFRDNDIGEGMNLIFPHSSLEMAYPVLKFAYPHNYDTVKAMVVADSYYWELYNIGLSSVIFDMGRFWYYNKQIYTPIPGVEPVPVEDVNIRHEVEKNDVVFIMQTEATLNRFAFGFFDKQADLYSKPYEKPEDQKDLATDQLRQIINKIKASDEWYELVRKKANNKGISMDEMLKIEAEYIIDQKNKKQ